MITTAADPAADRGEHAGEDPEDLLAHRDRDAPGDRLHRRGEHHPGGEAGEQDEHPLDPPSGGRPDQEVHGAEREPGHVQDRPEEVEDPERAVVPAGGRAEREGDRGEREHGERDRPGHLVGSAVPRVAHERRLGEEGRHCRGTEGECGDHDRSDATPGPALVPPRVGRPARRTGHLVTLCTSSGVRCGPGPDRGARPGRGKVADRDGQRRIPEATVARLPLYYRALLETAEAGVGTISSERLATLAGVNAAKVRKDLSYLGSYGTRGVGYEVDHLVHEISRELGLTQDWPVVIVGIGNLGHALANYRGFGARGFRVAALVDADPGKVDRKVAGLRGRRPRRRSPTSSPSAASRSASSRRRPARPRRSPTASSTPGSARSSTSRPRWSRCPRASRCARSTSRSSSRSSASTSPGARAGTARSGDPGGLGSASCAYRDGRGASGARAAGVERRSGAA